MAGAECHAKTSLEKTLFDEFTEWRFEDSPEFATMVGVHKYDDRLESYTLTSVERRRAKVEGFLKRAQQLRLDKRDRQCDESLCGELDLFIEMLQIYLDGHATMAYLFPLSRIDGLTVDFPQTISYMKLENLNDLNKLTQRLRAYPSQILEVVELLKEGIRNKYTLHCVSVANLVNTLTATIEQDPASTFYHGFVTKSKLKLTDTQETQLIEAIKETQKGLSIIRDFMRAEYIPACRSQIAITSIPNGGAYYMQCLKFHLGYAANPQDVHDIGLREVQRINNDIKEIIAGLKLQDSPKQFADRMRKDSQFVLKNQNEIKALYESILEDRIRPKLPEYFKNLPQAKLRLELMDASRAAGPVAFYIQGAKDGSRPATFYVNGNDVGRSPTYIMPALALHEANPGHHLQTSRLLETPNMSSFRLLIEDRRYTDMPSHFPIHSAYVEGWGLYCEFLGHEMDVYRSPYEKYGHYSQEMLRACRLVVDTGMHALGWSRQRAIDFLMENTASSLSEVESEVDRYITWPGQACAYKIGEIRIKKLREDAEKALGPVFDIRDFHEVVMNHMGTMDYLEKAVKKYIKENNVAMDRVLRL